MPLCPACQMRFTGFICECQQPERDRQQEKRDKINQLLANQRAKHIRPLLIKRDGTKPTGKN